jgi:hypothetical protein
MSTRRVVRAAAVGLLLTVNGGATPALVAQQPPGASGGAAPTTVPVEPFTDFDRAFDRVDRRARIMLGMIDCARRVAQLRAQGRFGPVDSLGNRGQCLRAGDITLGLFFSIAEGSTNPERLRAVDMRTGQRWTAPLDTAAAVAPALAQRDAFTDGAAPFVAANRQFGPITMRFDGDSIEVWFLPGDLLRADGPRALGGELGFVYSPDGQTRVRRIEASLPYAAWNAPDTGRVELVSDQAIPPLGHLLAYYVLLARRREVVLHSRTHTFIPAGWDVMAPWIISRRAGSGASTP